MTAKEFMNRAYWLELKINNLTEQLERTKALSKRVTAAYATVAVSHSRSVDSMENAIIKITEINAAMQTQLDKLSSVKKEIRETIDLVADPNCRMLLELRYLGMKSWQDIGNAMELGRTRVYTLHKTALSMVETVLAAREMSTHGE